MRWIPVGPLLGLGLTLAATGCATTEAMRRPSTPEEWRAEMQPPLSDGEAAAMADGPTLAQVVELSVRRNPRTAAMRERWLATIHVEPQVVTPPDPMLEAGYQFRSAETRVGPVEWSLGLKQQLPWPQKLWARGKVAATGADIAQLQYEAALRDTVIDAKDAYYELYYLDHAGPIVDRIERMLRNDALLAYGELNVGRTQLNEAFRAESQAAQLAYDRLLLAEQRAVQAERLRSILNLPPDTTIGPVVHAPVYAVSDDVAALHERAEDYAEILRIRGLETQREAYETFLAKLSRIPDFTLGGTYAFVDEARAMAPSPATSGSSTTTSAPQPPRDSGKDQVVGMVSMNLPIFEWRNRALIREQKALEQAMRLDALSELNTVRMGVAQAYYRVRLTERLVALYDDTLLPQASAVMDQAEIFFRNDQASFANVIETTLAYQNFMLARLRAAADHGKAIGQLERVLGTTAEPRQPSTVEATDDDGGNPSTPAAAMGDRQS